MNLPNRIKKMFERNASIIKSIFPGAFAKPITTINPDLNMFGMEDESYLSWQSYLTDLLARKVDDNKKYDDYDIMDSEVPEISAALDVTADYVLYADTGSKQKGFKVKSDDKQTQAAIDELDELLNFQTEAHGIVRDTCKYGDTFEEILVSSSGRGEVLGTRNIPVASMIVNKVNGILDKNAPFKQMGSGNEEIATLAYDEALHFSLPSDRNRYARYGKGVSRIEKSRLIYRQLRLMEESVIIRELSRANQNYGILVDVGDLQGEEALDFIDKYKKKVSRRKYIDPKTGRVNFRFNPLSVIEDIFIPTRQGSNSGIQNLNSADSNRNIDPINYFQNKMIYSTGVPKLLIGKEEDVNSKSTSDLQYVCFLRDVRRIQMYMESEIIRFYKIALLTKGIKNPKLKIIWPLANTIDEERKWRIEQIKSDIGIALANAALIDDYYFYQNFLGMTDEEIKTLTDRMDDTEEKLAAEIDADITDDGEEDDTETPPEETPSDTSNTEVLKTFECRLDSQSMIGFKRIAAFLESSPETKKLIQEYIHLTNTKLGA